MSSLPLFDWLESASAPASGASGGGCGSGSPLVGIAKLAAAGESIREGHQVEYFTLQCRSMLNRCTAERMPFTWTINPYRGCEFACKYCYARYTHEFMELDDLDFEQKIFVKQQAAWLLRRDLRRVKPHEEIAIGTATDPYQPAEKRYEVTRSMLQVLAECQNLRLGIVTKSNLIVRDLDLLQKIRQRNRLHVNLTVTTIDTARARILEPRAPRPDLRLQAVSQLVQAGIPTGVMVAPVVPGITDSRADLDALVRATAEAGGRHIVALPLFLKPCSASVFLPFLEKEFPELAREYRRRYDGRSLTTAAYRKQLSELMSRLRRKYGFSSRSDRKSPVESAQGSTGGCGSPPSRKSYVPAVKAPLLEPQLELF